MRLIDADAFELEMVEKILPLLTKIYGAAEATGGLHFSFMDCICNIEGQPTIDHENLCDRCRFTFFEKGEEDDGQ